MKKYIKNILVVAALLVLPFTSQASILNVNQGGTGTNYLGGILHGNGANAFSAIADPIANTLFGFDATDGLNSYFSIGTGLTYTHSSHTLSATNSGTVTSVGSSGSVTGGPITSTGTLSLVNDSASPGNSTYYGTDGSGTKGFFSLPTGGVSSVSNSDGSLTIAPTAGAVVASIAPAHPNIWTALQTFNRNNLTTTILPGASLTNTTAALVGTKQQNSPQLTWEGTGWDGAASQLIKIGATLKPSATANLFNFSFDGTVGASTTTNLLTISQSGNVSALNNLTATGGSVTAATSLQSGQNGGSTGTVILNGSTSGQLTLQAPAAVSSYNLTLPPAQGGANTIPLNNGSGILSWTAIPTGTIGGSIATNQIAFGSGTNTITGSSELTWDGSILDVTDGANRWFEINTTGGAQSGGMGDLDNSGNSTKILWDDAAHTITLNADDVIVPNATLSINSLSYAFPGSFGSAGSVLTDTSGAGALAWTAPHSTSPINGITIASVLARTTTGNIGGVYSVPMPNSGFYRLNVWLDVTAVTVGTVTITVAFTDFRGAAQTIQFFPVGLTAASVATTGYYPMQAFTVYALGGHNITVTATVTGTITYDAGMALEYIN